jgi:hypothetical protein
MVSWNPEGLIVAYAFVLEDNPKGLITAWACRDVVIIQIQ